MFTVNKNLVIVTFLAWMPLAAGAGTEFPSSPTIERRVEFWKKIFTRYKSNQIVVHDKDDLSLIVGVIDPSRQGYNALDKVGIERYIQVTLRSYIKVMQNFVDIGQAASKDSPMSTAIWRAYANNPQAKKRLLQGQAELRGQGGLADTFREAAYTSELYLPQMERIFREHRLPTELTRIVFVESMFKLKAKSKVGASGFWQLMPGTARAYLQVNRHNDERNSPLKATRAAARIMQENFRELQNWPLAITAYNHGLGGMKRAVYQTSSRKLSDIIDGYRSPSFGFASRNFYAEFLAALRVHAQYQVQASKDEKGYRELIGLSFKG